MRGAVERLRSRGLEVDGRVGDPDAYAAVQDEVNLHALYDELGVSTLPTHLSRWLRLDLPARAASPRCRRPTSSPRRR